MDAFFGCALIAVMILICVGEGVEPALVKMANELQRIADALEDENEEDNPNNTDAAT